MIAPAGYGLYEDRFFVAITEDLPNSKNIFLDYFGVDKCFRPDRLKDLILSYKSSRMFHQEAQDVEGLGRQRHSLFSAPQTMVCGIKPE